MAPESSSNLTPPQLYALLDILNHRETYREAESFKHERAIRQYGYPFTVAEISTSNNNLKSSSPLLQLFLTTCLLTVPGVGDLPPDFWPCHFQGIMEGLAKSNLSESYDKGTLGTRKTLATGASVIHEAVTRGLLSGVPTGDERLDLKTAAYDTTQASELARAWDDCIQELIHGELVDELFDHLAETADLEAHSPAVAAAVDYAILHIASLLHHVFVLSSEGQYLLKLLENVYGLVPFSMVRQTLRIGNAATMIHGMVRIFLAKMSVGAVTNWIGLTSGASDGMNLLQRIISLVLSWDASEFRKQASQVESAKDRPTKEQFSALRDYISMPAEAQRAMREISLAQQKSIVVVVLETANPQLIASLTDVQHTQCLAWLSAQLSARDRDEITKVMCKSSPDSLTAAVRGAVDTYDPFIRAIHEGMDLKEHITSVEKFLGDFIDTSKPKKEKSGSNSMFKRNGKPKAQETRPPSVEDYVALLRRNKALLFNYCHEFAKNCVDVREQFRGWAKTATAEFRAERGQAKQGGAGAMDEKLQSLYSQLPADTQETVVASLDAHAVYLDKLDQLSDTRMQRVLDQLAKQSSEDLEKATEGGSGSSSGKSTPKASCPPSPRASTGGPSMSGPGVFLMRWDSLMDETLITPETPSGPVRTGKQVKGKKAWGKTVADDTKGEWDPGALAIEEDKAVPEAPNVTVVIESLGGSFREAVNARIGDPLMTLSNKSAAAEGALDGRVPEGDGLASGVERIALAG